MRHLLLLGTLAACGTPDSSVALDPLPGSPFFGDDTSRGVGGSGSFAPAAFGFAATFGVDDGEVAEWESVDGAKQDPSVSLVLFTWAYLEEGDAAGRCRVTYPLKDAEVVVDLFDYATLTAGTTGPWTMRGVSATLDGSTATTSCTGLDPSVWGDPRDLLDGTTLAVGATVANDDVLASLVPSQVDLTRHAGAAVQWAPFGRYEDLSSDTYQVGATRYAADGIVRTEGGDRFDGASLPDGAYDVHPLLLLRADALLVE